MCIYADGISFARYADGIRFARVRFLFCQTRFGEVNQRQQCVHFCILFVL